ncbi:MAG: hypothetical protein K0S47_2816 [Herbinix sp.]|jgi:hypothetical protein|nr:hypothetical protein [Herbinix sp.]
MEGHLVFIEPMNKINSLSIYGSNYALPTVYLLLINQRINQSTT